MRKVFVCFIIKGYDIYFDEFVMIFVWKQKKKEKSNNFFRPIFCTSIFCTLKAKSKTAHSVPTFQILLILTFSRVSLRHLIQ